MQLRHTLLAALGIALVACPLLVSANPKGGQSCHPQLLLVFSDSLSDNGNYYNLTGDVYPPSPPYFNGRFSNGLVWPEVTAGLANIKLKDFAYGGATACEANQAIVAQLGFPGLHSPISIASQVGNYTATGVHTIKRGPCKRVAVVEGGDNDFGAIFAVYQADPNPPELNETFFANTAAGIASCLFSEVASLYAAGELNIIVGTPIDASKTPFAVKQVPLAVQFAAALGAAYNQALLQGVQHLQAQLTPHHRGKGKKGGHGKQKGDCCSTRRKSIQIVDLYSTFNSLFADPAALQAATGVTDVVNPCVVTAADGSIVSVCTDPETHFWWDDLHVTAGVHQYIGQLFEGAVSNL